MLPAIEGVMRQRVVVNYRVDAELAAAQLPTGLRPQLVDGQAITGICVI